MVRFGTACSGTLFAIWGIYSLVVLWLCALVDSAHQSPYLALAMAVSLAVVALVASERA